MMAEPSKKTSGIVEWQRRPRPPGAWERQAARVMGRPRRKRELRGWVLALATLLALGLVMFFCFRAVVLWLG